MRISDWSSDVCSSDLLDGKLSVDYQVAPEDEALLADILDMARVRLPREFEQLAFSAGIEDWIRAVFACNQYVDAQAPWALRKSDPDRMRGGLMTLFQAVRTLARSIHPGVPAGASARLDQMGIAADARDYAALADAGWFAKLRS